MAIPRCPRTIGKFSVFQKGDGQDVLLANEIYAYTHDSEIPSQGNSENGDDRQRDYGPTSW